MIPDRSKEKKKRIFSINNFLKKFRQIMKNGKVPKAFGVQQTASKQDVLDLKLNTEK